MEDRKSGRKKGQRRKGKVTDEVEKGKEEGEEKQRMLKLKPPKTQELLCCCWELGS